MRIADLDISKLIEAIGIVLASVIFEGVEKDTPAHSLRERAQLNAEIMGRFAAVLYCGDKVGPEVLELIDLFTAHMQEKHLLSMARVLGPGGVLSQMHIPPESAR
ncbi:hypothetical protein [Pseudomonas sp. GZD-222]|uniref:hypothetical protein n=1 Tax=Pseudomonas sp. GZD-222 TaxID=3404805 RepID=UPI003BB71D22